MADTKFPDIPKNLGKNSEKSKEDVKENIKKAAAQATMTILDPKKASLADKFAHLFFEGDLKDAGKYMMGVMIDHAKDALIEAFRIMVRGGASKPGSSSYYTMYDKPSYTSYYYSSGGYSQSKPEEKKNEKPSGEIFDPRRVVISDRVTCELILKDVRELIAQTGSASVSDFFTFARRRTKSPDGTSTLPVPDWAATDFGWLNINDARPVSCKGGYYCSLPDPYPIN